MRGIVKCMSLCFIHLKHYFLNFSPFYSFFTQCWSCKYGVNTKSICLANVYMPCDDRSENVVGEYQTILGELQETIKSANFDQIVCAGDFNADPSRGRLWDHLLHFVDHNQFIVNDLTLPIDSFPILSPAHNATSWHDQ